MVASLLLHVLFAVVVPSFKFESIKKMPEILRVELLPPPPVLAPPAPIEPTKPEPIKKPDAVKPDVVKPIEPKPAPVTKAVQKPSPIEQVETPPQADAPAEVIAVAPKVDRAPVISAPAPVEAPKPAEPSPADVDNALGEYGSVLGRAIAKHKQYPKIAQMRGWQGDVLLDLKIDSSGNVISAKVRESSGHEALDNQALEMVRKASPFPAPPEALRNRTFNITVPVSFKLENA